MPNSNIDEMFSFQKTKDITKCLNHHTLVELKNGKRFWYYPTYIGPTKIIGSRWRRRYRRWIYFETNINEIISIKCSNM